MHRRRFNLPPLDFIHGFEAAARTLSFTKAAEELFITQSAVSRQIRSLEEHLGVPLFDRRPRSLGLTEAGRALQRTTVEVLERLQEATDRLRTEGVAPHLTVTTTGGFASLWLIPRLRKFTALQPDVDVRISASYKTVDLERNLVDVAIRYCAEDEAPDEAVRLFGEELFPVCSPALLTDGAHPLRDVAGLARHALLHMDEARDHMDWDTWLTAHGHAGLKPAVSMRFDSYEQLIQAALSGQGVAMGIGRLVRGLMAEGRLVAPFGEAATGTRSYFVIRSAISGQRPHVQAFVTWVTQEAEAALANEGRGLPSSPPPAARSGGAKRPARSKR
jgi:DNA-binding transcriptional LysR family regulator